MKTLRNLPFILCDLCVSAVKKVFMSTRKPSGARQGIARNKDHAAPENRGLSLIKKRSQTLHPSRKKWFLRSVCATDLLHDFLNPELDFGRDPGMRVKRLDQVQDLLGFGEAEEISELPDFSQLRQTQQDLFLR